MTNSFSTSVATMHSLTESDEIAPADNNNEDFLSKALKLHRTPPYHIAAEQAFLGALMFNNNCFEHVSDFLLPEHFADAIHSKIYHAIITLIERGQVADVVTLSKYFAQEDALKELGGAEYLYRLVENIVSIINARDYGRTIYDLYLRRQLISISDDITNRAYTYSVENEAPQQIEQAEQSLFRLATKGNFASNLRTFKDVMINTLKQAEAAYRRDGAVVGVSTGLADLDRCLGGLHKSDLLILAGRPSMGKTALATNIAFNVARSGGKVAFFSLEMSAEQIATRLLGQEASVSSHNIRSGNVNEKEFAALVEASKIISHIDFFIDDTAALTVPALRTRARRLKRQSGLDLIVVDYLQLMSAMRSGGGNIENRVQEISEITRGLKAVAKELAVPVIALSQLSRAVEQREDKRPQLADLRESGAIEQDADTVMFVFREEYYVERKEPSQSSEKHSGAEKYQDWQDRLRKCANIAEVIVAKQRHGPVRTVKLHYESYLTKFSDLIESEIHNDRPKR